MTDDEASSLFKKAKAIAIRLGFREESDDIAQETIILYHQREKIGNNLTNVVRDAIRSHYGTGLKNWYRDGRYEIPWDTESPDNTMEKDFKRTLSKMLRLTIDRPERIILMLRYRWGMTNEEIADVFGISSSRISQVFEAFMRRNMQVLRGEKKTDL